MKKILSERNIVVILFIAALTIFSFAQEDAKKVEKMYLETEGLLFISTPKQTADNIAPTGKPVIATPQVK